MSRRDRLLIAGVVSTLLAWASWRTMDEPWVKNWSATEDILDAIGYALCVLALLLFFAGMRLPK